MVRLTGPALGRTVLQSGQSAEAQSMQLSSNEGWGTSGSPAARRLSLVPLQVDSKATLGLGGVAVVLGAVVASMGFFSYLGARQHAKWANVGNQRNPSPLLELELEKSRR